MKQYRVIRMQCSEKEREQLEAVGISEDAIIELVSSENKKDICMLTVEKTVFCMRKELFNLLEIEEI